ncbi:MAG: hypothetical protein IJT01_07130, partial [Selenomonadaceae bacterium]|nr:hypothetical protein [Selenomonadaceae bacterium]
GRVNASAVYWTNLAVLYHNAAVCEKSLFPDMAALHIQKAEQAVMQHGSPLMVLRIMRSRKLLFGEECDSFQIRQEAVMLKQFFQKVNGVLGAYEDFWGFLRERPYLFIV